MEYIELEQTFSFISRGKSPKYVETSDVCVINQACIRWDGIDFGKVKYQNPDNYNRSAILQDNDLLIASTGTGTLGRCCVFHVPDNRTYLADSHVTVVRGSFPITAELIKYYMMYPNTQATLYAQCVNGSTNQIELSKEKLQKFHIPSMDSYTQELCVRLLKRIDSIIGLRKRQLKKLDELVKARFVEMFGDPMLNPKGYSTKKYGELFQLNAGGTPSKTVPEYWENGTISWIGSNMCQNTILYGNDGKYISQAGYDHSSARLFPVDTVLIALVGATIGKTALLKFETSTNQNVLGVRHIVESGYNPMFVYYYTQFLYQKFMNIGDGGFNMASKGFVSELPIYDVDIDEQIQFAQFAEQLDKSKAVVQQSLDKLEALKKSLMQEYFG